MENTEIIRYPIMVKRSRKFSMVVYFTPIYRTRAIITRGLYTFYPLFEVHLCTVTFALMYG
jgi:hypothetical protein